MSRPDLDLAIVGAGPVGAALALALEVACFRSTVFDARSVGLMPGPDRWLAISHGSRLILERLGLWSPLACARQGIAAIQTIEVAQSGGAARTQLHAEELDLPALGYVVSYHDLCRACAEKLLAAGIDIRWSDRVEALGTTPACAWLQNKNGEFSARLAVISDGAAASVRGAQVFAYGQCALVADLECAAPAGTAHERFGAEGPIALLPLARGHALVWTLAEGPIAEVLRLDEEAFLARLTAAFGAEPGFFTGVRERRSFPLRFIWSPNHAGPHLLRLGNAAQTLHPVAGQGFNLGLRDAFELAQSLQHENADALGSERLLQRYLAQRRIDRNVTAAATHGLVALFAPQHLLLRTARDRALQVLDHAGWLRRSLMKGMIFGWH